MECIECKPGLNRILNNFTNKCECEKGYKEDSADKLCKKCFNFDGKCYFECPNNTILNTKEGSCEKESLVY